MLIIILLVSISCSFVSLICTLDYIFNGIPRHTYIGYGSLRDACTFKEAVVETYRWPFESRNVIGYLFGVLSVIFSFPGVILAGTIRILFELLYRIWDLGYYERWKKCQKEKQ